MKFKIYGINLEGDEESLVIEADTVDEIRELAIRETAKRSWSDCWSEEII